MSELIKPTGQTEVDLTGTEAASIWTKNFTLLCVANLALFICSHVLFPCLPLYLVGIGGDQKDIGYVMGAYTIGATVMRPIAGLWVDRYGRKKIVLLGMVTIILSTLLYQLATHVSFMFMIRCIHGLGFGVASTALGTVAADSLPAVRMGEGMGYFGLTSSLSMAFAPMIGFWLVGNWGYHELFVSVILLSIVAFCCSLPVRESHLTALSPSGSAAGIWDRVLEKTAVPAFRVTLFITVVYGAVLSFISLYAAECGITNIGLFFTVMSLTMLVSRPISGRWTDQGHTDLVLYTGLLSLVLGMLAIGLSHAIMGLILAGAVVGVGFGFCLPTLQALAVRYTLPDRRGAATATFYVGIDMGVGLGTIAWGYVAQATSYRMMFLTTLIPLVLAGVIYYRFGAVPRQSVPEKQNPGH